MPSNAVAVSTPIPGIVSRRWATGSAAATAANSRSRPSRSFWSRRSSSSSRTRIAARNRGGTEASASARIMGIVVKAMRAPRHRDAVFLQEAVSALMRAVRVVIHSGTVHDATPVIPVGLVSSRPREQSIPLRTASRSASASVRSVLLRRTYRANILGRQEGHAMAVAAGQPPSGAQFRTPPSPHVSRAASEPPLKLQDGVESFPFDHMPPCIGEGGWYTLFARSTPIVVASMSASSSFTDGHQRSRQILSQNREESVP